MEDTYSYIYQTRGNSSPHGKPKIYLSGCYSEDERYFEAVGERLLDLYNVVIWRRNDSNDSYNLEELGQMQVCIFLITEHFLKNAGGVWHEEWTYVMEHKVPILPIMIDEHLQNLFNQFFGNIQCYRYLDELMNPDCDKITELLDALLLNEKTRENILKTFTKSVFLSYRKKDIAFVISLMKAIHNCKDFWDVRIWYDAYLLPGRNFDDSIKQALIDSNMMALLVTPSLLELPNYVHDPEYRIACEQSLPVIPVEMIDTDINSLKANYSGIACPVKYTDEMALNRLLSAYFPGTVSNNLVRERSNQDKEHRYLVGLAYLYGVEMEVDHERALTYITNAAELGYSEAYKQLVTMYRNGIGVEKNLLTAIEWQKEYISSLERAVKKNNDQEPLVEISVYIKRYRKYIREIWYLGDYYAESFLYEAALSCYQAVEAETRELMQIDSGENSFHLLSASSALCGDIYMSLGAIEEAWSSYEKYLENAKATYERFKTNTAKRDLSLAYHRLGDLCKENRKLDEAYTYYEKYTELVSTENEESSYQERRDLWLAYKNLAEILRENGNENKALELFEKAYKIADALAIEMRTPNAYRDLSICLDRLGMMKSSLGDINGAFQNFKHSLSIRRNLLDDIKTTDAAISFCVSLDYCGDCMSRQYQYDEALNYYDEALGIRKNLYAEHSNILMGSYLANSLVKVGDVYLKKNHLFNTKACYEEALQIRKDNYEKQSTHENRRNLAIAYQRMGNLLYRMDDYEHALIYYEKNKDLCYEVLNYDTSHQAKRDYKVSIVKIAEATEDLNRIDEAYSLFQEYYDQAVQVVEEYGYLTDYDDLAVACFNLGRFGNEEMMRKAYNLYSQMAEQFPEDIRYRQNRDYIRETFFI